MALLNHELYVEPVDAYIDPSVPRDRAIITHAHADHARPGHGSVLATPQTIALMQTRYGKECAKNFQPLTYGKPLHIGSTHITFFPAGHIPGSAQILIEDSGARALVTGDYKRVPDSTCEPFQLVQTDILVTEATFGLPVFRHPHPMAEIQKLLRSLSEFPERVHLIGAYALGKTQRVVRLLRDAGYDEPIYLHGAQMKLCQQYQAMGIDLGNIQPATIDRRAGFHGRIVIAPPSALKDRWSRRFDDPVIAMASGWMTIKQRAKQSLVELPLIISDHADWDELTNTISETTANTVWITHGREEALAYHCVQQGLLAQPLHLQGRDEEPEEDAP